MKSWLAVPFEALTVVIVGVGAGFLVNAVNADGIALDRDHFFAAQRVEPVAGTGAPQATEGTPPVVRNPVEETLARLAALGLQVVADEQVLLDFDDELYQQYEAYAFVDARNEGNYKDGHIPGAWHFDPYHVDRHAATVAPQCQSSGKVIVYCNGGQCVDSELAAQHLMNLGVPKELIFVYVGGIQAWKKAGRAVEKGERKSGNLVTEPGP
jgi:rhodanese-related sulfurtransferase